MKRYHINSGCFQFSFSFTFSRDKKKKNRKSPPKNENLQMTTERRFSSCSSSPSPSCRFPFSAKKFCRREKLCAAHNERRLKIVRETWENEFITRRKKTTEKLFTDQNGLEPGLLCGRNLINSEILVGALKF
jgi:hypothetical protein